MSHNRIRKHPQLRFLIVVNPHNGPGLSQLPDTNYLREIPRLSRHENVILLGYVHISYGKRPLPEVLRDIGVYHGWTSHQEYHPGLQVDGIMVDEVPYQEDPDVLKYLEALTGLVRSWNTNADGITKAGTVSYILALSFQHVGSCILHPGLRASPPHGPPGHLGL